MFFLHFCSDFHGISRYRERVHTMKNIAVRIFAFTMGIFMILLSAASCAKSGGEDDQIIIYSSAEDYRNEFVLNMLKEKFPDYDIKLEYYTTGDLAAKLKAEGQDTECDIILELESSYLQMLGDTVCTLDDIVDFSVYTEDLVPESHRYVPWIRMSGCIIINRDALEEADLPIPASYNDLLKPEYKDMISMPNPESSGTGYIFLLNMVNERGEDAAFEYFDKLAENVLQFTSSGSGPMQAVTSGEANIGLGMTFQAAQEITDGADIEILFFEEGAPYTAYSSAMIEGRQDNEKVREVFEYFVEVVTPEDKRLYAPEPIYKDKTFTIDNFPSDIAYGDMTGILDMDLKERLLDRWNH